MEMGSYKEWSGGIIQSFPVRRPEHITQNSCALLFHFPADWSFFSQELEHH